MQLSFHKFNEHEREPNILKRLHEGEVIALISDAGTPGISDPGMELVNLFPHLTLHACQSVRIVYPVILLIYKEVKSQTVVV